VTLHFVDHTAPAAPVITAPKDGDTINKADLNPDGTTTITGTGEPGDSVVVSSNGTPVPGCSASDNVTVAADGSWTCNATLPQGKDTLTAQQTDPSGNESAGSTPVTVTVDTITPDAPVITTPTDGSTINKADLNADGKATVSGTGEAGDTLSVTLNGTPLDGCQDLTVNAAGTWTCTATFPQGTDKLVASQTDPAGNTSADSAPVTVTVDTVAPAAPVITSPTNGEQTNNTTPTITGTGEPGATVTVSDGTPTICTAVVQADKTWSCTPTSALPTGPNTITATQTDPAGNPSGSSDPVTFIIDTTAPAAPQITSPTPGSSTNDTTPTVTGIGEPNATVTVIDKTDPSNPVTLCTATVQADGSWSCTPKTPLAEGSHTIDATQTDQAGNKSDPSGDVTFTVDTTAPAAPVIKTPADGSFTNDTTPTISGTGEPKDTLVVTDVTDPSNPVTLCTNVKVAADGTWTCTSSTLAEGSHTIQAQQTDPAGNTSPDSAKVTFTVDTTAPAAPVITSPTPGSFTNDTTPTITGTGEPDATVTVTDTTDPANPVTVCTATVQADGSWSCTPKTPLAEGPHTIDATQTDQAGNTSDPSSPVKFTVDTTAPDAPVIKTPTNGEATNDTTPTISGTGEPGDTLVVTNVTDPNNPTTLCSNVLVGADGTWTCKPDTLAEGSYTINATQTDPASNVSKPSDNVTFTVDTTKPEPPVIKTPADGEATNDNTPVVSGTGEPDALVTVTDTTDPDNPVTLCTATVQPDGTWSCTSSTLPDGNHTIQATQTDPAGNTSDPSKPVNITVDTVKPDAPVIKTPAAGSLTNNNTPTITGTGEPGAVVNVTDGNGNTLCSAVKVASDGTWSCTSAVKLPDGSNTITATQTDPAGNQSDPTSVTFTVDTTAPAAPKVDPSNGSQVTGTTDPGNTVTVTDPAGNPIKGCENIVADAQGTFTCTPDTKIPDGTELQVTATDPAGNTSPATTITVHGATVTVQYPTRTPGQTQTASGQNWVPGEKVTVTLTFADGSKAAVATVTADANGDVTVPAFVVPQGAAVGTARVTFNGTITGAKQATFTVTAAPQVPTGPSPLAPTGGSVAAPTSWTLGSMAGLIGLVLLFVAAARREKELGA